MVILTNIFLKYSKKEMDTLTN